MSSKKQHAQAHAQAKIGLEAIIRWGVYAVTLIPLVIFKDYISPFHFGKVVLFRPLVEVLTILYVILILKDRTYLPKPTKLFWAVTVFTAVFGVTTFTGVDPYQSLMGTLERMGGWFTFVHFWLFFVIASSVLRTKEHWMTLVKISVVASLVSTFYGFLQKTDFSLIVGAGNRSRIFGTLGNAALFAGYVLVHVYLALYLFLATKTDSRFFWLTVAVFDGIAVLLTAVRGSLFGLLISLVLFAFFCMFEARSIGISKRLRNYTIAIAGILVIVEFGLIAAHNTSFVKSSSYLSRLSDISPKTKLIQTRLWAWQAGIDGWNDSAKTVIFGWGPENFNIPFSVHFNPKFYSGPGAETLFDRAHNMFVEVLVTMGIVGFLSYLSVFLAVCMVLWKMFRQRGEGLTEQRLTAAVLFCGLVAYVIHDSFIFDTSGNFIAFFLFLGLVNYMGQSLQSGSEPAHAPGTLLSGTARGLLATGLGFGFGIALFGNGMFETAGQFFLFILSWAIGAIATYFVLGSERLSPVSRNDAVPATLRFSVAGILVIVSAILIYQTDLEPAWANYATSRAYLAAWAGDQKGAIAKFKEGLSYDTAISYEIRDRAAQYALEYYGKWGSVPGINPQQQLLTYIEEVKKNFTYKMDYLPYLYVSRLYIILGKNDPKSPYNDLALENSLKALQIAPNFVRTYFEVGQGYLNKQDLANAIVYFKRATELNPNVALSWWYLALTQLEHGDQVAGFMSLNRAISLGYEYKNEADLIRLINIYASTNDVATVVMYYEELVAVSPKNPQYHASLATAYARNGNIDGAVREAHVAAQLDPSFEPEARKFVQSLGRTW